MDNIWNQADYTSVYHYDLPDRHLEIKDVTGKNPEDVLKDWVDVNHPTATDIYGEYILKESVFCGEVVDTMPGVHFTKAQCQEFCSFCAGVTEPVSADAVLLVFNHIDKAANYADKEY